MRSRNSEPSSPERAWQYALRLLTARDYTVAKLRQKLLLRDFTEADTDVAIHRLEQGNWVNDRRFAERFAESAIASGRFFGARLRLEMRRRGIPSDVIEETLAARADAENEENDLRAMLERRFAGFSFAAASDRDKRRVMGFLQRRGFSISAIMRTIRQI